MIRYLCLWLIAVSALAMPATASQVLTRLPPSLDPTKAYLVVEIGKLDDAMLYGTLILARYDPARSDIAEPPVLTGGKEAGGRRPSDLRLHLLKPAMKDKEQRLYVAELDPGLWVVEGANDTAFSLGSSTMQLAAGTITDLGVLSIYSDFPQGQKRDVLTTGRVMKGALLGGLLGSRLPPPMPKAIDSRARRAGDMPLPAVLAAATPVIWAGEVRFGNHLGGLVNRMGGRKARFQALAAEQAAAGETERGDPAGSAVGETAGPTGP